MLIFENKGEVVGVSNPHPHGQIYATNFVFKTIETEARASAAASRGDGAGALPGGHRGARSRTAAGCSSRTRPRSPSCPTSPATPTRSTWPRRRRTRAWRVLEPTEVTDLAEALSAVLIRFDNLWRMRFPYVMLLHQAPTDGRDHRRLPFPHRVPSPPAQAQPPEIPRRAGDRRRELPLRHLSRGKGGRAPRPSRRPLPAARRRRVSDAAAFLEPIRRLHAGIRDAVVAACEDEAARGPGEDQPGRRGRHPLRGRSRQRGAHRRLLRPRDRTAGAARAGRRGPRGRRWCCPRARRRRTRSGA